MFDLSKRDASRAGSEQTSVAGHETHGAPAAGYSGGSRPSGATGIAVIGRSIQIVGDLRGDEDLRIEGDIEGSIHLPNHSLTIGSEGRIRADAYAKAVIIDGEIHGDIYASECVTIRAKARVMGNVLAARVSLEEGARFKGSIDMDAQSVKSALDKALGPAQSARTSTSARTPGTAETSPAGADKTAQPLSKSA